MLTAQVPPRGGESDDSVHGGDMNGCRSLVPWPEALHHSSGAPKYDKRVVEDAKHGAVRGQTTATRVREATGMQYFTFDDEGKPVAGERFRPMVKDLRRIPVHVEEPSLDVPALQMVEQPIDVDSFFRISVAYGSRAGYRSAQACPSCLCCSARGSV